MTFKVTVTKKKKQKKSYTSFKYSSVYGHNIFFANMGANTSAKYTTHCCIFCCLLKGKTLITCSVPWVWFTRADVKLTKINGLKWINEGNFLFFFFFKKSMLYYGIPAVIQLP